MATWITCIFSMLLMISGCHGIRWTEDLPDGAVIHACKGGNLTLPWNVSLVSGEDIHDIRWFYERHSEELIAMYTAGNFLAMPAYSQRVQHTGNAGIVISHVTTSEAGNYSVEVVAHDAHDAAGKLTTLRHSAVVDVAREPPVISGDNLQVRQEPVAVYDPSTDQWRVALTCGTLTSRGQPPVDVQWTTPSGSTLSSSSYESGSFKLLLPNPVSGGNYTCRLSPDSAAAACLSENSPLMLTAAVDVDKMEARLTLVEAKQESLLHENKALKADNAHLLQMVQDNVTAVIDEQLRILQSQINGNKQSINDLVSRQVSFHAMLSSYRQVSSWSTIILDVVISNEGGAYNKTTGQFTAPYTGTYFFAATASTHDSSHYAALYITVEGTEVSYLRADEDAYNMGSCQAVVHVTTGQRVWLESWNSNDYFHSDTTTFSGFLIHAD